MKAFQRKYCRDMDTFVAYGLYTVIPYMLLDLVSNCFSNVWSQVEQNLSNAKRRKLRHQGAPNHTK